MKLKHQRLFAYFQCTLFPLPLSVSTNKAEFSAYLLDRKFYAARLEKNHKETSDQHKFTNTASIIDYLKEIKFLPIFQIILIKETNYT